MIIWIDNTGTATGWTGENIDPWDTSTYDNYPTSLDDNCKPEIEEAYEEDDYNDFIPHSVILCSRPSEEHLWIMERTGHDV